MKKKSEKPRDSQKEGEDKKPIVANLDLRDAWDSMSEIDLLMKQLRKLKIYNQYLVFRGFDSRRIDQVLETGSDRALDKGTFLASESDMTDPTTDNTTNPIWYALRYPNSAIVVYDGRLFDLNANAPLWAEPKNRDPQVYKKALLAVFKIIK